MVGRSWQAGGRRVRIAAGVTVQATVALLSPLTPGALGDPPTPNVWHPIGPTLTTVLTLTRDPVDNDALYAGTNFGGVYASTDGGSTWTPVDAPFASDAVFGIALAQTTPRRILVATQSGGMYRSLDGGVTWAQANTGLITTSVRNVAYHPTDPSLALAATTSGIFRSVDGGATWAPTTSDTPALYGEQLLYDPANPSTVYAGTLGNGIRRSLDGGASWQGYTQGIGDFDIVSLSWDANEPGRLWTATPSGIFFRDAGDAEWTDWTLDMRPDAQIRHVATVPGRSEVLASTDKGIFVLSFDLPRAFGWTDWFEIDARMAVPDRTGTRIHAVYVINYLDVTENFGQSFAPSAQGMQNIFCGALATTDVDGDTGVYAGTGNDIRATSEALAQNGVLPWGLQLDIGGAIFDLATDDANPSRIFAGTEGYGVVRSTNYGNDWANASTGMVPRQVLDLDQSRGPSGTIYAATDAGCFVSRDEGRHWLQLAQDQNPVPIVDIEADPAFIDWVYYATADGRFFRSQNDGDSFFHLWSCPSGDSIRQIARAPFFEIYAILSSGAVYTSDDGGFNFFRRGETDIPERALCVAPVENRPWIAYVGTEFGGVYRTGSSGIQWEQRSAGINPSTIYSIATAPDDDFAVIAGAKGCVYTTTNEGVTWSRFSTGLPPDGLVSSLTFDPNDPTRIYAHITIEPREPVKPTPTRPPLVKGKPVPKFAEAALEPAPPPGAPASAGGMYVSRDRGRSWAVLTTNPSFTASNTVCASRTEPGLLLAGADLVGVGRSTDFGGTWTPSSDGMTLIVLSIAVDPANPSTIYAATFSSGIFKSTNGGDTWTNMGPTDVIVFHVTVDPIVTSTVYASTSVGVMRSDDGGASWRLAGQDAAYIITVASDPKVPGRIYLGSYTGKAYRSDDGGRTWLDVSRGLPVDDINAIVVSAIDSTVYAASAESGIYRSHDAGLTWWPANPAALGGYRVTDMAIDPATDDLYVGLWGGALRSSDRGNTWTPLPLNFGQDYPSAIAVMPMPGSHGVVFVSVLNEQGPGIDPGVPVVRSGDRGNTWVQIQNGIASHDALCVTSSSGPSPRIYLGALDGVYRSDDTGATWQSASVGLEGLTIWDIGVDAGNKNRAFAATSGGLFATSNGGVTWTPVPFDAANPGAMPLRITMADPGRLYVGTTERGVFFSETDGQTWGGGITPELTAMAPHALAVDPTDRNTLWIATADQGVAVSRDRGETWAFSTDGLGAEVMFTITIDPEEPTTIYATSQDAGIWVSTNAGQSWTELNAGLTNPFVTAFSIDVNDHKTIYAGTEGGGVFRLIRP